MIRKYLTNNRDSQQMFFKVFFVLLSLLFLAWFLISGVLNLQKTINTEIEHFKLVNQLLAKTTSKLEKEQTKFHIDLVNDLDKVNSVAFYPIRVVDDNTKTITDYKKTFFSPSLSIHEPVTIYLKDYNKNELIGYLYITLDLNKIRKSWLIDNIVMFGLMLLLFLFILISAWLIIKKEAIRLRKLEKISQKIIEDRLDEVFIHDITPITLPLLKNEEPCVIETALTRLINAKRLQDNALQNMEEDLAKSKDKELFYAQQFSLFQNRIIYELKSSLNHVQSGSKILANEYMSSEQQKAIEMIDLGIQDLDTKINQIIQVNLIEKGQIGIVLEKFSPKHLINDIVSEYQNAAKKKGLILQAQIKHIDYPLEADIKKISTILVALIENAIKFTTEGSITVVSQLYHLQHNVRWEIDVVDTGIGIHQQYLQSIFEPFFQVNPDAEQEILSSAVGLFLAKKIAELLKGELLVKSNVNKGSTFSLSLLLENENINPDLLTLKNKQLVIWDKNDELIKMDKELTEVGAKVHRFDDENLLLKYIIMNPKIDILLISPNISHKKIYTITEKIRKFEIDHRIFVVYYYLKGQKAPLDLLAVGVDYYECFDQEYEHTPQENHLKKLADLLI